MRNILLLILSLLINTACFAETSLTDKFNHAWKEQQTQRVHIDKNDITMGYGGADIYAKPPALLASALVIPQGANL